MAKKKPLPDESLSFMARLKRHHIFRVASAYAVMAYVLILVANAVFPDIGLSRADVRYIIAAAALLFPVALVLGWMFIPPSQQNPDQFSHWQQLRFRLGSVLAIVIVVLVTLSGMYLWHTKERYIRMESVSKHAVATPAPAAITSIPAKSIAVLPFENLNVDKKDAYFVVGTQDLILTKLAEIGGLKVISRTSTTRYSSHPESLRKIGAQLGVATILEGSVQKAGDQVLINVQLIDAKTDNHIWAQSYQRTLENVFGVEGEVAQAVADALKTQLTPAEQKHVATVPTQNVAAYDAFLKAESLAFKAQDSFKEADYLAADAAYRNAIALDPGFALAYARLAYNELSRHWFAQHLSSEQLTGVKATVERALALDPGLPQAHLALGYYYYWGYRRYDHAVAQFKRVLQLAPNSVDAILGLAFIARRRGQFEQTLTLLRQAVALAPRDGSNWSEYGITYLILRSYSQAAHQLENALAVDPNYLDAHDFFVRVLLFGFANAQKARAVFGPAVVWRISAANLLAGDAYNLIGPRAYTDMFSRHFRAALRDLDMEVATTDEQHLIKRVARVAIEIIAGRQTTIRPECEKLKPLVDAELAKDQDALGPLQRLSWVDLCLGQNTDAITAARQATDVLPLSKDAYFGVFQLEGLAEIEARAGRADDAVKLIQRLLSIPAGESMSDARLELDPLWDPLRNNPRFLVLLKKHSNKKSSIPGK